MVGSTVAIFLLLGAFLAIYVRAARARRYAERLAAENARLAELNRQEAVTDALTGLANRRALIEDLDDLGAKSGPGRTLLLFLFDLDGFKEYNDTFGHAAGDALLVRLARSLTGVCGRHARPYRMGGDEFCVLAPGGEADVQELLESLTGALSESGDRWQIGSSAGVVLIPEEADTASAALGLADVRLYAQKAGRASAGRQAADALLSVLTVRTPDLGAHTSNVALLARRTAAEMGLDEHEIRELIWAAELHDVGKAAVPIEIINKPDALDSEEWKLMRRHTLLGERILRAAPALAGAARLVRSSHERIDGRGYPDRLKGKEIPIGARIIFVCDAFDAMTSSRPYSESMSVQAALAELRRCSGTQFDAEVVEVFCRALESGLPQADARAA